MELTVVFGGLLSVSGLYALLTREQAGARSERPAGIDSNAVLDQLTSRTGTGYALTLTGLLILIAVASRPAVWWGESILDGPVPTGVYWFGTLAALAGSAAVAFSASNRIALAGIALTGTGGALLFGLAGDLVAGIGLICAAAAGGWATRFLPHERASDSATPSFPEPLLLAVSIVALFVLTASTLHRSATSESPLAESSETGGRSLPRPAVARRQVIAAASNGTSEAEPDDNAAQRTPSPWHLVATYGLLIVVASVGVWQQFSRQSARATAVDSFELASVRTSFADGITKPEADADHKEPDPAPGEQS